MVNLTKYNVPIGQFSRNILSEAIIQNDSFVYEEAEGFHTGYMGYVKHISLALYGNFELVETLCNNGISPFDSQYNETKGWYAAQWKAYCEMVLLTVKDYFKMSKYGTTYSINRALHNIQGCYSDLYELNYESDRKSKEDINERLHVATSFIIKFIEVINSLPNPPKPLYLKKNKLYIVGDIYDQISKMIFDICEHVSRVNTSEDISWDLYYNGVWSRFFDSDSGKAWKIIRYKVGMLLYEEVKSIEKYAHYKNTRILGFCLNVLGLTNDPKRLKINKETYLLAKNIITWTKQNYMAIRQINTDLADSVLIGCISYDDKGKRLVKTYHKGTKKEAPKEYLDLDEYHEI